MLDSTSLLISFLTNVIVNLLPCTDGLVHAVIYLVVSAAGNPSLDAWTFDAPRRSPRSREAAANVSRRICSMRRRAVVPPSWTAGCRGGLGIFRVISAGFH